jgi:hypothetical protein
MAEDYIHDVSRFTTAQTFFRANRTGIADAAAIKLEDIEKFNRIVFGPDVEDAQLNLAETNMPEAPGSDVTQADRISYTLKLLKYHPEL